MAQSMENSTAEREVTGSIPGTDLDRNDTLSEKWEMARGNAFALQWPDLYVARMTT